jgi:hypothetical protein
MKIVYEKMKYQIKEKRTLSLSVFSVLFATTIYLMRSSSDEFGYFMDALSILLVFFCAFLVPVIGIGIYISGLLILKVFRHSFENNGSFTPILLLVSGTVLAFTLPLPPLAEEALFIKYQNDYEHIITMVKSNQFGDVNDCKANSPSSYKFETPKGFEHLSEGMISVFCYPDGINVGFASYNYSVSLNYFENPSNIINSRNCDFRSGVLKKINENWYVCKLMHTW